MNDENQSVAYELIDEYKARLRHIQPEQNSQGILKYQEKITEMRLTALKKERDYLQEVMEKHEISEMSFDTLEKSLDRREEALSANVDSEFMYLIGRVVRTWRRYKRYNKDEEETDFAKLRLSKEIQLRALQAAHTFLEEYAKEQERATLAYAVMLDYERMIDRLKKPVEQNNEKEEEQKEDLRLKVIDIERSEIHAMFEAGEITREQSKELRRFVNNIESVTLYEYVE